MATDDRLRYAGFQAAVWSASGLCSTRGAIYLFRAIAHGASAAQRNPKVGPQ